MNYWQDRISKYKQENSFEQRGVNSNHKQEPLIFDDENWTALESNKMSIYETADGTQIILNNPEEANVYQNEETGEIVIWGAEGVDVHGSNDGVSLTILDSTIESIDLGDGNDIVYLENSYLNSIQAGDGDDGLYFVNSSVNAINTSSGDDRLEILNSEVEMLNSGLGEDNVSVKNSILKFAELEKGRDILYSENSFLGSIKTGKKDDMVVVDDSTAVLIDGGKHDDTILIDNSTVKNEVTGNQGVDTISISSSQVNSLSGGNDKDMFLDIDSEVTTSDINKKDIHSNYDYKIYEPTFDLSSDITKSRISTITDKELTPEEEVQALTICFLVENLDSFNYQFDAQELEDGILRDGYNFVKMLMDMGIPKEEIIKSIEDQELMIAELTAALNGESEFTFEEVYEKWMGVPYDQEKMMTYFEAESVYSVGVYGLQNAETFSAATREAEDLDELYNMYVDYYGNEDIAREKLNEMLADSMVDNPEFGSPTKVYISEEKELVIYYPGYDNPSIEDIESSELIIKHPGGLNYTKCIDDYKTEFENTMGISIEDAQVAYASAQLDAFGRGGAFQSLIDKYCAEQDGFADKLASICQIGGISLMAVGSVLTLVCPPAGVPMMTAGRGLSIAGMFIDNGVEIVDGVTSENGLTKEELWAETKDIIIDIALLYAGKGSSKVAGHVNNILRDAGYSKLLANIAELGTDVTLSICSDLILTGEVDLTGEGISQLLGLVTGVAGVKIDAYTKQVWDDSLVIYKNGDLDGAMKYAVDMGIPERTVKKYYKQIELDTANKIFTETGDLSLAMSYVQNSPVLESADIQNLEVSLMLEHLDSKGIDVEKYKGYDFSGPQGKLVSADIAMLYEANITGVDVNDLMVPTVTDVNTGLETANIGDVFEVDGDEYIYMKTNDGSCTQLKISKSTYCRLFPPVDRYASGQGGSGDCYLVSSLNTMMTDPRTRVLLLSCFSENPDGSVVIRLPGSNVKTQVMIRPNQTINDLGVGSNKHMRGSQGMQLLEYAYKVETTHKKLEPLEMTQQAWDDNIEQWNSFGIETYDEFLEFCVAPNDRMQNVIENYVGEEFSYNEWEQIVRFVKDISSDSSNVGYASDEKYIKFIFHQAGIYDDEMIFYIMDTYINPWVEVKNLSVSPDTLNPFPAGVDIIEYETGNGGHSYSVFDAFGLENSRLLPISCFEDIIADPTNYENSVITAGTVYTREKFIQDYLNPNKISSQYYQEHPDLYKDVLEQYPSEKDLPDGIYSTHAYSVYIKENEFGEIIVEVVNPWTPKSAGENKSIILTVDEFQTYFSQLYIAEIPEQ